MKKQIMYADTVNGKFDMTYEEMLQQVRENPKRRINKIENINESYIGKIFRYSYGYDMIINEYAICVRQTCKSLMLVECERLLNNDDGSGKGRSWTTGKIAQNAKKYRTQKRALYIDGVKQHEYFSRGKGNAWYLWDGKLNNYDTWD